MGSSDIASTISGVATASGTTASGGLIDMTSVGLNAYTVSAEDYAGNATAETVTYAVQYTFSGLLSPVATMTKAFKLNRSTVPIKFRISDANGDYVQDAVARLELILQLNGEPIGEELNIESTNPTTEGDLFRYDGEDMQYIYNLSTSTDGLDVGTWLLRVILDDGWVQNHLISFRS